MYNSRIGNWQLIFFYHRNQHNTGKCKIETLCVRNYPKVTDGFLKDAAEKCPFLTLLDITGTSCTVEEIGRYKTQRPNTKIVCNEYVEKTEK